MLGGRAGWGRSWFKTRRETRMIWAWSVVRGDDPASRESEELDVTSAWERFFPLPLLVELPLADEERAWAD